MRSLVAWLRGVRCASGLISIVIVALFGSFGFGCAVDLPQGTRHPMPSPYRDLEWHEENQAYLDASSLYQNTGEVVLLGSEPQCTRTDPPCVAERARWKGRKSFQGHLFQSLLRCRVGESECETVRASEHEMRRLALWKWREQRGISLRRDAEKRANDRADEQARLSEWHAMQEEEESNTDEESGGSQQEVASTGVEEGAGGDAPAKPRLLAETLVLAANAVAESAMQNVAVLFPPQAATAPPPAPTAGEQARDWHKEPASVVLALRSEKVGCSSPFGETVSDRGLALKSLDGMSELDRQRIRDTFDAEQGRGTLDVWVAEAREKESKFIARRCVAGY